MARRGDGGARGDDRTKLVAQNRKARHEFELMERFEAGMALMGTEVKSLREGGGDLKDSYAEVRGGEVFLVGCRISPYSHGSCVNHMPERDRKLLLHRQEIKKLLGRTQERGLTLVPLCIYFKDGRAKLARQAGRRTQARDGSRDAAPPGMRETPWDARHARR
jgi:SsrA-binding protein